MKITLKKIMIILMAFTVGCGTIKQNIKARQNLKKCKFKFEKVTFDKISFKKKIIPKAVNLDLFLKITNPTKDDVALDKVRAVVYLDRIKTTKLKHNKFVRIEAKNSSVEKIDIKIPMSALKNFTRKKRPKNTIIDGKVFINLLVGDSVIKTDFFVRIKASLPIPWKEIDAAIAKRKAKYINKFKLKKKKKRLKRFKKRFR
ncbi:hypothetical protein ACFL20_07230 [Spirochaetota bacterium]